MTSQKKGNLAMKTQKLHPSFHSRRRELGMTIVEVSVSLGLLAIGLTQAVPSMYELMMKNQLNATSNAMVAGLNHARASAITLGRDITICPSSDSTSCVENAWVSGWIVFSDTNGNGQAEESEIIRASTLDNKLNMQGFGESIMFRPNGTTNMQVDAIISSCYQKSEESSICSDVTVGAYGRIKSKLRTSA
jgi:type IV fimbrial biogenesis protein FimT